MLRWSAGSALALRPRRCAAEALTTTLVIAFGFPGAADSARAVAQSSHLAPRVLLDAAACREAKALSDADCDTAFANAKAEFYEKAPKFPSRAACERYFRRCMIGDISEGGRRIAFIPQMRGFAIEDGRERRVIPVADGGGVEFLFQPRAATTPDSYVSGAKTAKAQKDWRMMAASPEAPASGERIPPPGDEGDGGASVPGSPQAYPVPPAALQDLKDRERKFGSPQDP